MHRKKNAKPKSPLISEIKNTQFKLKLNESRYKAEQDELNAQLAESTHALNKVQKNIEDLKISLSYASETKDQPLKKAFEGHENKFKDFENKTSDQILEILHRKICEQTKTLDLLHNEKREKENVFSLKIREYKAQINSHTEGPNQRILNRLRDDFQKISMKTEETKRVNEKYKEIFQALVDEKPLYERRIEKAEEEIEAQKCEILSLRVIHREAERSRSCSEVELRSVKKIAEEARNRREKELAPLKDRRKEKVTLSPKDRRFSTTTRDIHFQGKTSSILQAMENSYIAAFEKLKNATGKSTTREIEEHLMNQHRIRKELEERANEMKEKLTELTTLKESFEEELDQRIANSEISKEIADLDAEIEVKEGELNQVTERVGSCRARLSFVGPLLTDIRSVVENIYNTLILEDDSEKIVNGISIVEIINLCQERLEKRMKEIYENKLTLEFQLDEDDDEDLGYTTNNSVVPPRRKMKDYSSEDSEDEKLVSRELLKKKATLLAETKSKQKSTNRQLLKL